MRLLSFELFRTSWQLQTRIIASAGIPTFVAVMGLIWVFAFPDRGNHAIGGAAIFWAMTLFWDTLCDLTELWPWRHERHFKRPAPVSMMGVSRSDAARKALLARLPMATILPFVKRDR